MKKKYVKIDVIYSDNILFFFFSDLVFLCVFFFFQAEDGIRDGHVTGVQTCALPILELAGEICKASPVAVREAKAAIDRGFGLPLADAIELEELAWRRGVASEDRREGVAAFNEKRDPKWQGR